MPGRRPTNPSNASDRATVRLANDRAKVEELLNGVVAVLDKHAYAKASIFAVRLALHEALANAFEHGHKALPKATPITVSYEVSDACVTIIVEDQGPGFVPAAVPDPTLDENLEVPSGRGLMLMRAYMTKVAYNARGNRLEMVYQKP